MCRATKWCPHPYFHIVYFLANEETPPSLQFFWSSCYYVLVLHSLCVDLLALFFCAGTLLECYGYKVKLGKILKLRFPFIHLEEDICDTCLYQSIFFYFLDKSADLLRKVIAPLNEPSKRLYVNFRQNIFADSIGLLIAYSPLSCNRKLFSACNQSWKNFMPQNWFAPPTLLPSL